MFSTGTYQVSLDCGAQSLSTLTVDCTLSGTGWSELMGDVGFGSVTYDHTTGLLIGYATTYA